MREDACDHVGSLAERKALRRMVHRWRSLLVIATTMIVASIETGVANVIFPVLRRTFDLTTTSLGVFASIGLLARAFCGPVWGMLADRFGRKRVLAFAVIGWSACIGATGLARTFPQFLALYTLGMVGAVAAEPITDSLLSDFFRPEQRGRAYGFLRGLLSLGVGVAMPVIGWLCARPDGWRLSFYFMAAVQVVFGCLLALGLREPTAGASERVELRLVRNRFSVRDLPKLWRISSVRWFAVNYVLATSLILLAYLPTFMTEVRGFTVQAASRMYGVMHIGAVIGAFLGGYLGDWAERRRPLRGRIQLMQVYLVVFSLSTFVIFQMPWSGEPFAYGMLFIFGIVFPIGFSGCVLPMLSTVVLPEMRSTGFGLLACLCQGVGLTVGSLLVGTLANRYGLPRMLFLSITVPYALNALIWTRFYRAYPRDVATIQRELSTRVVSSN